MSLVFIGLVALNVLAAVYICLKGSKKAKATLILFSAINFRLNRYYKAKLIGSSVYNTTVSSVPVGKTDNQTSSSSSTLKIFLWVSLAISIPTIAIMIAALAGSIDWGDEIMLASIGPLVLEVTLVALTISEIVMAASSGKFKGIKPQVSVEFTDKVKSGNLSSIPLKDDVSKEIPYEGEVVEMPQNEDILPPS